MSACKLLKNAQTRSAGRLARRPSTTARRSSIAKAAADRPLWAPGVLAPEYLTGDLPADRGFDPLGFGSSPEALKWMIQAELVHCRWAMLGVAGVLVQEIVRPDVFFYEAGLPQNLPEPFTNINLGGLLAIEFLMVHWVEVRRWQDIRKFGSVNEDPIFKGNKVPNTIPGYPGGIFDPFGFAKGDFKELQTKEIKNGRLAMISYMGYILQAQATGKGPIACLQAHLANPFGDNIATNIGTCTIPTSVDVEGITIPLTCLWPGQH